MSQLIRQKHQNDILFPILIAIFTASKNNLLDKLFHNKLFLLFATCR